MYNIFELNEKSLDDLKIIATEMGIDDENRDRTQLIYDIIDHQVDHPDIKKSDKPKKKQKPKNEMVCWKNKCSLLVYEKRILDLPSKKR